MSYLTNARLDQMDDSPEEEEPEEQGMSFLGHLDELRWNLMRSSIAILVGAIICFLNKGIIFDDIILAPKNSDFFTSRALCKLSELLQMGKGLCFPDLTLSIINFEITGQFLIHLKVSFISGIIISFPYIIWEVWRFIKPGLYDEEKKYAKGLVFFCSLLFFMGIAFGYYIITPFSVHFLGSYSVTEQIQNTISLTSYISFITAIVMAAGLMFEMPMIVYFLAKLGLVGPELLAKYRKHSIVVILLISGIITPPDVASQIILTLPLYFLYEISIIIAKRVAKNNAKDE